MSDIINNDKRARQLLLFRGLLSSRGLSPTDIDCAADFSPNAFIYLEVKRRGQRMPYGQRLHYERMIKAFKSRVDALVVVAAHNEPCDNDVVVADTDVQLLYRKSEGIWRKPKVAAKFRDVWEWFAGLHGVRVVDCCKDS